MILKKNCGKSWQEIFYRQKLVEQMEKKKEAIEVRGNEYENL